MICKECGSEFNKENFDVCPYCLSPVEEKKEEDAIDSSNKEVAIDNLHLNGRSENVPYRANVNTPNELLDCFQSRNERELWDIEEKTATAFETLIDYEHSESEENNPSEKEEISINLDIEINDLNLSVRATNALTRAKIKTIRDLINFSKSNTISDLRNVGEKTVKELEDLISRVYSGELTINNQIKQINEIAIELPFENMPAEMGQLGIEALKPLGLSGQAVSSLLAKGITCCEDLKGVTRKDIKSLIGRQWEEKIFEVSSNLGNSMVATFNAVLDQYKGTRGFNVLVRRGKGETLQDIAENPEGKGEKITRERVRQLEQKTMKVFMPFAEATLDALKKGKPYFNVQDVLDVFDDDEYDIVLLYIAKTCDLYEYLDFAEIFIEKNGNESAEEKIFTLIQEIVGEGCEIDEHRERIEDLLEAHDYGYFEFEWVISLLRKNGYRIYGNLVIRGKSNYPPVCMHVIRKHFPYGIKITQTDSTKSEDLIRLRQIVNDNYPEVELPDSDRTMCSAITRKGLILCGRGMYMPQENVIIDEALLSDVKHYIDEKEESQVFYSEIYVEFEGALSLLCGIDNYNYLHGVLALVFPDSYEYTKDYLIKKDKEGTNNARIEDRLYEFLCKENRPVSRKELEQEFRGFSNATLMMPFTKDSRILQWEYNCFTCMDLFDITNNDRLVIKQILERIFEENNGYASDGIAFARISEECHQFLEKNGVKNELNLHFLLSKMFAQEMSFHRPHIAKKDIVDISSTKNVLIKQLGEPDIITYQECKSLCEKMKWPESAKNFIEPEVDWGYVRIAKDEYIKEGLFEISNEVRDELRSILCQRMKEGVLPLQEIDYEELPDGNYEWNAFLLASIIEKYLDEYTIIQPETKDRRYQRGIVVEKKQGYTATLKLLRKRCK